MSLGGSGMREIREGTKRNAEAQSSEHPLRLTASRGTETLRKALAAMLRPPGAPRIRLASDGGAGDVAQSLEDPAARRVVQPHIVRHFHQVRHGAHALLSCQHPGLRQSAA